MITHIVMEKRVCFAKIINFSFFSISHTCYENEDLLETNALNK
ncbi:hypothetical protein STFR1_50093 [Bacillus vallismortis]